MSTILATKQEPPLPQTVVPLQEGVETKNDEKPAPTLAEKTIHINQQKPPPSSGLVTGNNPEPDLQSQGKQKLQAAPKEEQRTSQSKGAAADSSQLSELNKGPQSQQLTPEEYRQVLDFAEKNTQELTRQLERSYKLLDQESESLKEQIQTISQILNDPDSKIQRLLDKTSDMFLKIEQRQKRLQELMEGSREHSDLTRAVILLGEITEDISRFVDSPGDSLSYKFAQIQVAVDSLERRLDDYRDNHS